MDELLAAAAAALGAPEEMVMRSARARAQADGVAVEDILAAWSGGAPAPSPAPSSAPSTAPSSAPSSATPAPEPSATTSEDSPTQTSADDDLPAEGVEAAATAPIATTVEPAAVAVLTRSVPAAELPAPVLTGRRDSMWALLAGIAALFLAGVVFTVFAPAVTADRTENVAISSGAEIYQTEGCWYCHTQLVRPVITDVFLGPVTHPEDIDARRFLGVQRIGPDLTTMADREPTDSPDWIREFLLRPATLSEGIHPAYTYLSSAELDALVAYLGSLRG